jgi:hypothetical protein
MGNLTKLKNRLDKIGVDITLTSNYPWIYLSEVNGKKVTERFQSEHGFTIGYASIREDTEMKFADTKELFKVLRKYRCLKNQE